MTMREWRENREEASRGDWERMRLLATMVMQPHCKNRLNPKKLLPLPWDKNKTAPDREAPQESKEEAKARFLKRTGHG